MIIDGFIIFFALMAFICALSMIISKHPMRVALALVGTMLSIASLFALIGNHVLALFQILIYIGAIMVFMIYVIMLLGPRDTSYLKRFSSYAISGGILLILALMFIPTHLQAPLEELPQFEIKIADFSKDFLNNYFLYFEMTSVLLVVATVAAIAIIKRKKHEV